MSTRFLKSLGWLLLLTAATLAGLPWAASAQYSGGSGTADDPYHIGTVADWTSLSNTPAHWNAHFVLVADLDFGGAALTPVGTWSAPFSGVFDGGNQVVRNGSIDLPQRDAVGLFGRLGAAGMILNLGVADVAVSGFFNVGGLVGFNEGTVVSCYATGTVSGSGGVGGLTGGNDGMVLSSYATGTVTGMFYVGGLVGINSGMLESCYATGTVSGSIAVGGLVGENSSMVEYCYATGAVSGSSHVGGLVGSGEGGSVASSYWDTETSGMTSSAGGEGRTTAEMTYPHAANTYVGWDFDRVWATDADYSINRGYPYLRPYVPSGYSGGSGTSADPYRIGTVDDWHALATSPLHWRVHFVLVADLDFGGADLTPVGTRSVHFSGVFDGGGRVLRNGRINLPEATGVGLFGSVSSTGMILNLGVENVAVSGSGSVGGLVGSNWGTVAFSYATGAVSGSSNVGGLVGRNRGTVASSYAVGAVSGSSHVGGLVGASEGGSVASSYWDTETSGVTSSAGGEGRTTAEMTYPHAANTYVGWDFDRVWAADVDHSMNQGYPYLRPYEPPIEGEGEAPAEGEGEAPAEGEGEPPVEGEWPYEGEGEPPIEGEGEPPIEGEGEAPAEGEGEPPAEGEGEPPAEGEGEPPAEGEGEAPVEGEGEAPAEGEGEAPAEGEGEAPAEGEWPYEGEGEPPIEGEGEWPYEGEPPFEGEGEAPAEGEGEPPAEGEGEGEPPVEGEGEPPVEGEDDADNWCGRLLQCNGKDGLTPEDLRKHLGDWLLVGVTLLTLLRLGGYARRG